MGLGSGFEELHKRTVILKKITTLGCIYFPADYWKDILEKSLGLSEGSLSEEATKDLSDLVESAVELEVEDTSLSR